MRRWTPVLPVAVLLLAGCTGHDSSQVRFRIAAPSAMFDAPPGVTVTGLPPGARVTVNASDTDGGDHTWTSSATYLANSAGTVDLSTTAPVSGSYTGVSGTGLLWSMTAPGVNYFDPPNQQLTVHLTASLNGHRVAEASMTRQLRDATVTERATTVAQDGFDGIMFTPRDTGTRRPALLAFGGSEGGTLTGIDIARALSAKGYPALGIGYFKAPGLPDTLARIPLDYFVAALHWLASQPGVDPHHIDVFGVSRGSEAALLLGVNFPDLVFGVVAAVPSSVVNAGFPDLGQPAWTLRGQPVPGVSRWDYGDPRPADNPAAIIPVERIAGPVLLVCGEADALWPSCPYADAISARLGAHPHTELREPGAGHEVGFPVPNVPTTPQSRFGGNQQADALGRLDAWPAIIDFLTAQTG